MEHVRIDKWLWSVRLYKTRSAAATACKGGHVRVNGASVKAAAKVRVGDIIEARVGDWPRKVVVVELIEKRVGAPIAVTCYDDQSPPRPTNKTMDPAFGYRPPGSGKPTKRERRQIEKLLGRRK